MKICSLRFVYHSLILLCFSMLLGCVKVSYGEKESEASITQSNSLRRRAELEHQKRISTKEPVSWLNQDRPCKKDTNNHILQRGDDFGALYSYCHTYYDYQLIKTYKSNYGQVKRYRLSTELGSVWIDYYDNPDLDNEAVILIFPVLGGNYHIENFFADAFNHRYDTAIVHRNNEFKDPRNFDRLERLFQDNIIKDRIALDFFENEMKIKKFGTFGISRGAINVASTAAVDRRLKRNVLVLGGSDLRSIVSNSDQKGLARFIERIAKHEKKDKQWVVEEIGKRVFTEPKNLASYMNPKDTLLILGIFDSTVPFENGLQLRELIKKPETIYLLSDHYLGLLYTQILQFILPFGLTILPFDYVETQSLAFYDREFEADKGDSMTIYDILTYPSNLLFGFFNK